MRSTYRGAHRDYYQIRVAGKSLQTFKDFIGFNRPDRKQKLADMRQPLKAYRTEACAIEPIKTVEISDIVIPMVDFTVDNPSHVFYANGILTHNTQGLTLDNVQVDIGHYWSGQPSMCYVALSRSRSAHGLRVVGDVGRLSKRIKTDGRVRRWI